MLVWGCYIKIACDLHITYRKSAFEHPTFCSYRTKIAAVNDSSCNICSPVSKAKAMDIGLAMQVALSTLEGNQNHAVIHVALLSTEKRAGVRHQSS
jgi:hypothetical protein